MRKIILTVTSLLSVVALNSFAGGLLTNTNQHIAFLRYFARGASTEIDGVYSNPAGLAFLEDGFHVSLNIQSAYQERDIFSTYPLFGYRGDENNTHKYNGSASAPFVPSAQAAYKNGKWTISGSFAVTGGGGKASFNGGLGSFDSKIMAQIYNSSTGTLTPDKYTILSSMDGRQFIYGVQLGLTYAITDYLSVFAGGRMNYFDGGYEGFLNATVNSNIPVMGGVELAAIELDCDQTGWGVTPIIGVDAKLGKWNIGVKYEMTTNLNIENKTNKAEVRQNGSAILMSPSHPLSAFQDGVNTPSDIPGLLTTAVRYEFLPTLRASVEGHYFFDKDAGMAADKQRALSRGTIEYLAGVEWDATSRISLSVGGQRTDYGLTDDYQSDISCSCDSYAIGFGGSVKLNEKLKVNVAYFWNMYDDYTKNVAASPTGGYNGTTLAGTDVYTRTNKAFGVGIDYKF